MLSARQTATVLVLAIAPLLLSDDGTVKNSEAALPLLPPPQEIELATNGKVFRLTEDVVIARCFSATLTDEQTAKDFADSIKKTMGLALPVTLGLPDGRSILLGIPKRDEELAEKCRKLGLKINPQIGNEGYVLQVTPDRIVLVANTSVGLFYGAQTLRQLVDPRSKSIPCVTIRDWPDLPQRWVMYDIGRFQTINVAYCKRIIESLARVKINGLMFYMEDDYDFDAHPCLGREGTFTRDKVSDLVAFANRYHVQLIPHFQSLGHMYGILRHPEMADLRCGKSAEVVCPLASRKVDFFGEIYGELCRAFSNTKFFHVGGDEFERGFAQCPKCQADVKRIGRAALYARHMNDLHTLLKKRGRTMICWPSHNEGGWKGYYNPAHTREHSLTLQAEDELPKDIVIFEWNYSAADDYPTIPLYQKAGLRNIIVCPQVTGWLSLYPDLRTGFDNTKHLFHYAAEHKLLGGCICTWSLYRGANFETCWPGLLFAAECAWSNAKAKQRDFAGKFAHRWFGIREDVTADMEKLLYFPHRGPQGKRFWRVGSAAPEIFFASPKKLRRYLRISVEGDVLKQSLELLALSDETLTVVDRIKAKAKRNLITLDFIEFAILNYRHVARKCLLIEKAARNYQKAAAMQGAKDLQPMRNAIFALEDLLNDYPYMVRMFERLAKECGGRREDVVPEAGQSDWAQKTNRTRNITPVMDLQRKTEDLLNAMRAAVSKAYANELLPPPSEYGFEELPGVKIGMWSSKDVAPSNVNEPRRLTFEVTGLIVEAGMYEVIYDHEAGREDLSILSTGLYVSYRQGDIGPDQMTRVAEDIHDGFTGKQDEHNIYLMRLKEYDNGIRYFIVGEVYADQATQNDGIVWLRKKKTE